MTWRAAQAYIASTTDQYQFNAATLVRRVGGVPTSWPRVVGTLRSRSTNTVLVCCGASLPLVVFILLPTFGHHGGCVLWVVFSQAQVQHLNELHRRSAPLVW